MKKFYLFLLIANCFLVQNAFAVSVEVGSAVFINDIRFVNGLTNVGVLGAFSGDSVYVTNGAGEVGSSSNMSQLTYAREAELIRQYYGISGSDTEVMNSSYRNSWEGQVSYSPSWYSQNPQIWEGVSNTPRVSISNANAGSTGQYDPLFRDNTLSTSIRNNSGVRAAYFTGLAGGTSSNSAEGYGDGSTQLYMTFAPGTHDLSITYNLWASASGMEASSIVDLRTFVQAHFSTISGQVTNLQWYLPTPTSAELDITQSGGSDFSEFRSGGFHLGITAAASGVTGVLVFSSHAEGSVQNEPNQTVPEPATMLLLGLGLVGLAGVRRKFEE